MSRAPRNRQSNYYVPALEKGLDILETLASSSRPMSLAELSRRLQKTSSEIFRMVDTLERRQYINRDAATAGYQLSMKLYELSHMHSPVEHLMKAAARPLQELSLEVNESCHLAVIASDKLVVVMEELSPARVRLSVEVGSAAPVLHTVSGQLLLAHMPDGDQAAYLEGLAEYKSLTRAQRQEMLRTLEKIRKDGHAVSASEYRTGTDLAVLVGNPAVGVAASLAMPVLAGGTNEGKERMLLRAMKQCARQINENLRLTGPAGEGQEIEDAALRNGSEGAAGSRGEL